MDRFERSPSWHSSIAIHSVLSQSIHFECFVPFDGVTIPFDYDFLPPFSLCGLFRSPIGSPSDHHQISSVFYVSSIPFSCLSLPFSLFNPFTLSLSLTSSHLSTTLIASLLVGATQSFDSFREKSSPNSRFPSLSSIRLFI